MGLIGNNNTKKNNTGKSLKNTISKFDNQIDKLKNEIEEHKEKFREFGLKDKARARHEFDMRKMKERELTKLTGMLSNLEQKLTNGGKKKNNNNFSFNNPLYHNSKSKRKTLKRSYGSRNLYSKYNSNHGKEKREYQLPINATNDELINEMLKPRNYQYTNSDRELLKELNDLEKKFK
jgi:hypothetical protein